MYESYWQSDDDGLADKQEVDQRCDCMVDVSLFFCLLWFLFNVRRRARPSGGSVSGGGGGGGGGGDGSAIVLQFQLRRRTRQILSRQPLSRPMFLLVRTPLVHASVFCLYSENNRQRDDRRELEGTHFFTFPASSVPLHNCLCSPPTAQPESDLIRDLVQAIL